MRLINCVLLVFILWGFHYKKKKKKKVRHKYVTVLFYVCSQQGDFSNIQLLTSQNSKVQVNFIDILAFTELKTSSNVSGRNCNPYSRVELLYQVNLTCI